MKVCIKGILREECDGPEIFRMWKSQRLMLNITFLVLSDIPKVKSAKLIQKLPEFTNLEINGVQTFQIIPIHCFLSTFKWLPLISHPLLQLILPSQLSFPYLSNLLDSKGLPGGSVVKNPPANACPCRRPGFSL